MALSGKGHGKTVLVTGASSGIGSELTRVFARDGFNLVLVARNERRLAALADELRRTAGVTITVIPKDLSHPTAPDEIYHTLVDKTIGVDILVNNAGFSVYGSFWTTDGEREVQMIQTNIVALTRLTKLFLSSMVSRRAGKILNVASTASFASGPLSAMYNASKASS